jgi:hypothetical protein
MKRASLIARLGMLTGACVALPTLLACLDHPLKKVEYEQSVEDEEGIAISVNKDVDILFVIDNSGSMGEEQGLLSENFGAFIGVLEAEDVRANYRIGITTSDNGNPKCGPTGPEAGNFVDTSCLSRLPNFLFGGAEPVDAQYACTDYCDPAWDTIELKPTPITGDPEPRPRPWIENIEGATNLPDGLSTVDAMRCIAPQGINGCGFESQLESMYLSLRRANMEGENELGFLRDNAILSVVFLTDEEDCSLNKDWGLAFSPDNEGGNEVFWTLPDEPSPTSGVCWNAGVSCMPMGGPTYDSCVATNKDIEGNPVSDANADEQAVIYPLQRYIDLIDQLEFDKKALNPDQEVLIAAITGVPTGYPDEGIIYADGPDPTVVEDFGIGFGCEQPGVAQAVPPVRLKEFAENFRQNDEDVNLFSICQNSYEGALEAIANAIRDQIRPACMRACVGDTDAATEGLQPQCILTETYRDESNQLIENQIPECGADDAVPEGADACFVLLTDQNGSTGTTADDMQQECIDEGWNLEFRLVRRDGVAAPGGAAASATCQLSQNKELDCPGLPG